MAMERFKKANAGTLAKSPEVRIAPSGLIAITQSAWKLIGAPEAVEFYFDRDKAVLALKPCKDRKDPNGYMVKPPPAASPGAAVTVRGTSVFKFYGIGIEGPTRETPYIEDGMLCFKVPKARVKPA